MRRERRQLTRREWNGITSRRPVVRKIPPPDKSVRTGADLVDHVYAEDVSTTPIVVEDVSMEKIAVAPTAQIAVALAKVRYARRVVRDAKGDPERGAEILETLRELGYEGEGLT